MESLLKNHGFVSNGILNLSPAEAFELCNKGAVIIDVREEYLNNFKAFDVPEVLFFPESRFRQDYQTLPKNKCLIFADAVGLRSKEAVNLIRDKGFKMIANLAGGIVDWERDGLPVKINKSERLSGSCMCQLKKREGVKRRGGEREI